ncbi:MAG TPA: TolC family protein [Ignavibacteriales bacterium]|nr:TolC family protein [Ignavibacteriales bacterium]
MFIRHFMLISMLMFSAGYAQQQQPAASKSLSMEEAISTALNINPEIKASKEKINSASGRLWSGISLPSPEISLDYEYIPSGQPLTSFSERTFSITQPVEFPTNYFLRRAKFTDERMIAETELNQTELSVVSKVKEAYYEALSKQEELKLAKENLAIAEDFRKKAEIRFNTGEATHLERLTAKVQYSEALNNLNIRQNELKSLLAELNYAMGFGQDSQPESYFLSDSLSFDGADYSLDKLFEAASRSNSQLKISELRLNASSVERTLAWTSLLPSFSLSYFNQSRDGISGFYGASLGVTVPLWFMFDQKGKIQEAEANKSIAESELRSAKNEFYLKVNNAFNAYQIADKQVRLYQSDILPEAEEVYRAASRSYEAGEITYVEFLQAKQTVISSRSNYINSLLSYNQAVISLEEAVGKRLK